MSRFLLAVAVSVCAAVSAFAGFTQQQDFRPATPEELAMKSVPSSPGASAAVLDWVRLDDDTNSISSEYHRIKVFNEEGKKFADVEIPYVAGYPYAGRVVDIAARTIQPDGKIVPFDGKIYDKVLYKSGGLRLRAKTFSLAGVQPGSILEYRFQRRWADMLLINTTWNIQREIPVLHAKMVLRPMDTGGLYGSFFTYFNLPAGKVPVKKRNEYELEVTDVPALVSEELAPPEEQLTARVNFYYTSSRVKPETFWPETTATWTKESENFIGNTDKLKPAVASLAGKTPMETVKNVYAKAQSFKNLSYEDEPTEKDKKNAADVVSKASGYRMELTRAFVAMARAAGLQANVVRVAPRDERFFAKQIPDADQMPTEIAVVTVDGKPIYLDPGTPGAPFGIVSWEKSNVPGFKFAKGQPAELLVVAEQKEDSAVLHRAADLRLNEDKLEGTVTATYTGQEALRARLRSHGDDEAARTKAFEDEAKEWFPDGATIKLTELKGATSFAEPIVAKFDVTLANFVSSAGSRTVLPMSVFASSAKNPFAPATRTHAIYYRYPKTITDEVKVTLPETMTAASVPPPVKIDVGAIAYNNEMKQNGREVTFRRSLKVNTMLIDVKHYNNLRTVYSTIATEDQKPLVLVSK
jgi:Domain of Unknown Function with PDB structure (DUF3857)/Transglutaminase-like superfamily